MPSVRLWLLIGSICIPAIVTWVAGVLALRHRDAPDFAERVFGLRRIAEMALGAGIVAWIVSEYGVRGDQPAAWTWAEPLLIWVTLAAAMFPVNKRLHAEWTFASFLSFTIRLMLIRVVSAVFFLTPLLVYGVGIDRWPWVLGVILALLVFLEPLARWAYMMRPFPDETLARRIAERAAGAKCRPPALGLAGPVRGFFANAFALPGRQAGSILITQAVLEHLDAEEVVAIACHELGHLEYFTPARMRKRSLLLLGIVVAGSLWMPLARDLLHQTGFGVALLWFAAVAPVVLLQRRGRGQRAELDCDRRALELGADPRSLISGLEKLHALMYLPRRFDAARDQSLSHPSLARRIQAIRTAAGIEGGAPVEPLERTELKARSGWTITIDQAGVQIARGGRTVHAWTFDELRLLYVRGSWRGTALVVVPETGRAVSAILARDQVALAQSLLDRIDQRLPQRIESRNRRLQIATRLAGLVLMLSSLLTVRLGQQWFLAAAVAATVAFFIPSAATGGVAAAVAACAMLFVLLAGASVTQSLVIGAAVAAALVLLVTAVLIRWKPESFEGRGERAALLVVTLAAFVAVWYLAGGLRWSPGNQGLALAFAIRETAPALAGVVALGAALATRRRWGWQIAGGVLLVLGLLLTSLAIVNPARLPGDFSLFSDREIVPHPVAPQLIAHQQLPWEVLSLRASPSGTRFMVQQDADEDGGPWFGGTSEGSPLASFAGISDVVFIGDDRLLTYENAPQNVRIALRAWDPALPSSWSLKLSSSDYGSVDASPAGAWQLTTPSQDLIISGSLGSQNVVASRFPRLKQRGMTALSASLLVAVPYERSTRGRFFRTGHEFVAEDLHGRIIRRVLPMPVRVRSPRVGGDSFLLQTFDGQRTHFALLDQTLQAKPLGFLTGNCVAVVWDGRHVIAAMHDNRIVVWNLARATAVAFAVPPWNELEAMDARGSSTIAIAESIGRGADLLVYRLPPDPH